MIKYNILGDIYSFDDSMGIMMNVKRKYEIFWAKEYDYFYSNTWKKDQFINLIPTFISNVLNKCSEISVDMLINNGIMTFDKEMFIEKYYYTFNFQDGINQLIDQYMMIENEKELVLEYHKEIKDARKCWTGGGFGIEGAIKGSVKADILNAGNKIVHNSGDNRRMEIDLEKIENKKEVFYRQKDPKNKVVVLIRKIIDGCCNGVFIELFNNGVCKPINLDYRKAQAVIKNGVKIINSGEANCEKLIACIKQAIDLDVFCYDLYETAYTNGLIKEYELEEIAKDIGAYDRYYVENIRVYFSEEEERKYYDEQENELKKILENTNESINVFLQYRANRGIDEHTFQVIELSKKGCSKITGGLKKLKREWMKIAYRPYDYEKESLYTYHIPLEIEELVNKIEKNILMLEQKIDDFRIYLKQNPELIQKAHEAEKEANIKNKKEEDILEEIIRSGKSDIEMILKINSAGLTSNNAKQLKGKLEAKVKETYESEKNESEETKYSLTGGIFWIVVALILYHFDHNIIGNILLLSGVIGILNFFIHIKNIRRFKEYQKKCSLNDDGTIKIIE